MIRTACRENGRTREDRHAGNSGKFTGALRKKARGRLASPTLAVLLSMAMISTCAVAVPAHTLAYTFDVPAQSAILVDAETGQVLYAKNEHQPLPPASITKIMTMLLAMEAIDSGRVKLDDVVVASQRAHETRGSSIFLAVGERMTVETLLKSVAIQSANDAATALAEFIAGSEEAFVAKMNERAKELGMNDTTFRNAHGLDEPGHVSSAYDIAIMARELVKHPKILEWTSTWQDSIRDGKFTLFNTNKLIRRYPGADGLKTGHTDEAGYCLAGTAKRDDLRLIAVVMGTPSDEARIAQTIALLDYGFREFTKVKLAKKGDKMGEADVQDGARLKVDAVAAQDVRLLVPVGSEESVERRVEIRPLTAPVEQGQVIGRAVFTDKGREIGTANLVAAQDVPRAGFFTLLWRRVVGFIVGLFRRG